jgi:Flp pilus assembly protein TadG
MKRLTQALRRFRRDDEGSVVLEAVLVMPFMLWAYVGLFVYWDAFRSINTVQKAAYTVSDMISREMLTITPAYLTGMDTLIERLIDQSQNANLRVTSVYFDEADQRNEVHWSMSPGGAMPPLTTAALQLLADQIPTMSDGDFVVIVEVVVGFTPSFNVGVSDMDIRQFIVTRPRFVPRICMQGYSCPV